MESGPTDKCVGGCCTDTGVGEVKLSPVPTEEQTSPTQKSMEW